MTVKTLELSVRAHARRRETVLGQIRAWIARSQARRHLLDLDDRLLADIGLTRLDAEREARKPFWIE